MGPLETITAILHQAAKRRPHLKRYMRNALKRLESVSKMQITFKDKAQTDEKAEHTR
jgi:hypothetical protein